MQSRISKQATYWLSVVAIGLTVGLSIQFVTAWTEPTATPPGGNVGAPINTSDTGQSKGGNLILSNVAGTTNGLIVNIGNIGFGTASPSYKLDVQGGDINTSGVYRKGGAAGASTTCSAGNSPSGLTISGGIITSAGACTAIGGSGTGDITDVIAGSGLTGGGSSGSVTLNVGAGTGITVAADTVGLNINTAGCVAASRLYWTGTGLACGTDATGSGAGDNLGNHIATQNLTMGSYMITGGSDSRTVALGAGNIIKFDWSPESGTGAYTPRSTVDSTDLSLQRRPGTGGNITCGSGQAIQTIGADGGTTCVAASGGGGTLSCTVVTQNSGASNYIRQANCSSGYYATGGGRSSSQFSPEGAASSRPVGNPPTGWLCENAWPITVSTAYAVCCRTQ